MIKDITLGQFFPGDSPIHNIDPRVKIVMAMFMIFSIFFASGLYSMIFVFIVCTVLVLMSKISLSVIFKGLKPLIFILVFTTLMQILLTKQGVMWFKLGFIEIYSDGVYNAIYMISRIILLISTTSVLLSYTTSPIRLTDGIEGLLSPLSNLGVKGVHDFAMMMSIALRFIPTLIEETDKIMSAQRARGTDFSSGSIIKRAKAMLPIFIPLLFSAIRRAEELSVAMICRCYRGGVGRTKLNALKMKGSDFVWFILSVIFTTGTVLIEVLI